MFTHPQLWRALDMLAERHGLSASGLAKEAKLDATSFNPSKRAFRRGKTAHKRWPSLESLAAVLRATGTSWQEFGALLTGEAAAAELPVLSLAQAGQDGYFDDAGYPVGTGMYGAPNPGIADPAAYALEIAGDSMAPLLRAGDLVLVSPQAEIRKGDRVIVRTRTGEVLAKEVGRLTSKEITLRSLNPAYAERTLPRAECRFIHRILWVRQ